jgi:hypothetical protein
MSWDLMQGCLSHQDGAFQNTGIIQIDGNNNAKAKNVIYRTNPGFFVNILNRIS